MFRVFNVGWWRWVVSRQREEAGPINTRAWSRECARSLVTTESSIKQRKPAVVYLSDPKQLPKTQGEKSLLLAECQEPDQREAANRRCLPLQSPAQSTRILKNKPRNMFARFLKEVSEPMVPGLP
jgi:hypothetical protein